MLTDMTSYSDALSIVSNRMDQIPSKDSMLDRYILILQKYMKSWFSFLRVVQLQLLRYYLSGGDITHAVPDNTGYITEGQLSCVSTVILVRL